MSFQSKLPPLALRLSINKYKTLLFILDNRKDNISLQLKDKYLKYIYLIDKEYLELRLYPQDAIYIVKLLIDAININSNINYYKEFQKNRLEFIKGDEY